MLKKLLDLLAPEPEVAGFSKEDVPLAVAVLLVEVARADYERDSAESDMLRRLVEEAFGLDDDDVTELLRRAEAEVDVTVALDRHVDLINRHCSAEEKYDLVKGLWEVAMADGELHHYEEHLVRRLAELLYVPHRQFIRSKHEAGR
jgi:uncharacterized tellurite resistance protein B-like protein